MENVFLIAVKHLSGEHQGYWGNLVVQINLLHLTLLVLICFALPMFMLTANWLKSAYKNAKAFISGCAGNGIEIKPKQNTVQSN